MAPSNYGKKYLEAMEDFTDLQRTLVDETITEVWNDDNLSRDMIIAVAYGLLGKE